MWERFGLWIGKTSWARRSCIVACIPIGFVIDISTELPKHLWWGFQDWWEAFREQYNEFVGDLW
jgi:hypothetical protein